MKKIYTYIQKHIQKYPVLYISSITSLFWVVIASVILLSLDNRMLFVRGSSTPVTVQSKAEWKTALNK